MHQHIYDLFKKYTKEVMILVNTNANIKGFWSDNRSDTESIALMHSELSEALEGLREPGDGSSKIPGFSKVEEELADCVIRIFDTCLQRGYRLPEAIIAKHEYNTTRPYMHGKNF